MSEEPGTGPTSLIVVSVADGKQEEAAQRFADDLSIEPEVALQIIKGAPIVFINGLTKNEVRSLTPRLQKLSEAGIEFRLTQKATNQLPRINWPIRPTFSPGQAVDSPTYRWENNAFVCPGCGESFLFQRMGKLPLTTDAPVAAAAAPAAAPKHDSGMPKAIGGASVGERLRARGSGKSSKPSNPKLEAVKEEAPDAEAPATEEASAAAESGGEGFGDLGNIDDLLGGESESLDLGAGLDEPGAPPAAEAPAEAGGGEELSLDGELGGGELISSMEGLDSTAGPTPDGDDPGGEKFNVFVSSIKDQAKRDEAAKIIARVRGIDIKEAKKMTSRAMIKAADAISKEKAEGLLKEFKELKLSARMSKVAGS